MRYLIDTNCCIFLFAGGYQALADRISALDKDEVGLSAIVYAELALGSANGKEPSPSALDRLIRIFPVLPFDEAAARAYALLPFKRGSFDRLLAAHALTLDLTLITNNERDFADIPGLKVENWTI
ncbi:type II toxin-antitoxin system VapC family toxin [Rhizorhabdus dicambivorans]|uniref:Ribonuclease VapC n=1 Tax=Rhizorhabdus dicambivorans TaxID=1850238 RepID=A0A2A4G1F1_9SPHN|nr:type II toxin-antitoxin system VapC family toxin [Rhizorhabdus dicambivorans]ATE63391.1 PIN domain-containing protein [Rhizorhabdus dicambivorans]PCE43607.1 PIN domain-containing protein [Rhizorhabdus dicambivorans]